MPQSNFVIDPYRCPELPHDLINAEVAFIQIDIHSGEVQYVCNYGEIPYDDLGEFDKNEKNLRIFFPTNIDPEIFIKLVEDHYEDINEIVVCARQGNRDHIGRLTLGENGEERYKALSNTFWKRSDYMWEL